MTWGFGQAASIYFNKHHVSKCPNCLLKHLMAKTLFPLPFLPKHTQINHEQAVCGIHQGGNKEVSNEKSDHNAFTAIISHYFLLNSLTGSFHTVSPCGRVQLSLPKIQSGIEHTRKYIRHRSLSSHLRASFALSGPQLEPCTPAGHSRS